jgi:hypothetical protein
MLRIEGHNFTGAYSVNSLIPEQSIGNYLKFTDVESLKTFFEGKLTQFITAIHIIKADNALELMDETLEKPSELAELCRSVNNDMWVKTTSGNIEELFQSFGITVERIQEKTSLVFINKTQELTSYDFLSHFPNDCDVFELVMPKEEDSESVPYVLPIDNTSLVEGMIAYHADSVEPQIPGKNAADIEVTLFNKCYPLVRPDLIDNVAFKACTTIN